MRSSQMLLLLSTSCMLLFSCKKEESFEPGNGNASPGKLQGAWDFVAMNAYTNSTATSRTGNDIEKTITITDYETVNNAGTLTIDAGKIVAAGITYTVDTEINAEYYLNNVKEDAFTLPFQFTSPPATSTSIYQLVGADSIHLDQSFITIDGAQGGASSVVSGARYAFSGDTLVLTAKYYKADTVNDAGVVMNLVDVARTVTKYKKR